MAVIEFQDFSCYYRNKKEYFTALKEITLRVEPGELLVILGPSGCGKTTLLKSIMGLCDYIQGQLRIDGVEIDSFRLQSSNIGYVSQQSGLYPHLTVYENIAFPLRTIRTPQQEVDRRVKEVAQQLSIDFLLTRKPRQLSGGQQQRVAIARALVKKPVILLLDEPFSNVDPSLHSELRQLVRQLHGIYGTTMIFVTHDLQDAYSLAQRIVMLDEGQITAVGTPGQLIEKGYLQ